MPYSRKARYLLSTGLLLVALGTGFSSHVHPTHLLSQNRIDGLRGFAMGVGIALEIASLLLIRRERLSGGSGMTGLNE